MKIIKFLTAIGSGIGTYQAMKNTKVPQPVKMLSAFAGAGVGFVLGGKLDNLINKSADEKAYGDAVTQNKTELQQILQNNTKLPPDQQITATQTPAQQKDNANKLFTAMDGAGTDLPAIEAVFKKQKNDIDILNLIEAFGTRAGTSMFATSTKSDLQDWLTSDGATDAVNAILETKSLITKRF